MTKALRELLQICRSLYVDEVVWFCYDEFDVAVNDVDGSALDQRIYEEEASM